MADYNDMQQIADSIVGNQFQINITDEGFIQLLADDYTGLYLTVNATEVCIGDRGIQESDNGSTVEVVELDLADAPPQEPETTLRVERVQ